MISISVKKSDVDKSDTFVPEFYIYQADVRTSSLSRSGVEVKLGDISSISDGEHSAIPRNNNKGVRYLYGRNIREGTVDFDPISDAPYITKEDYDKFPRCHVSQNDVLIAIYGTVGKSAVYKEEYVGLAGIPRHIANISLNAGAPISPEYLTSVFRSKYGKAQMKSMMTGNIQQLLSLGSLRNFTIPVPDETLLSRITDLEAEANNCQIKASLLLKHAFNTFYDGLSFDIKGIVGSSYFSIASKDLLNNDSWVPEFYNNEFENVELELKDNNSGVELGEISNLSHGEEIGSGLYIPYTDRSVGDVAFIRTSDIVNNEADLYPDYYVSSADLQQLKQKANPGDILFTKDGKIGATGMLEEIDKVVLSSGVEIISLNDKGKETGLTSEYLFTALSTKEVGLYGAKKRAVYASTIPHLRENKLKEIIIPIIDKRHIADITADVREAFRLKNRRKKLLLESENLIESFLKI